ncbi:hypothetical protein T440DRAFT_94 [Plenodomus tracheiphilus IPT5]|uniref:Uncharacterized protein n=1 Tax=Plenodomus tracheiphilus IPT5 TaxID=1408161 RepID=A0A6A7BLZ0_9PLEO|nr:hypothetical protein T440DRAFT_94 [Plenodomus tracheiphilus IPT5]
MFIGSLLDVTLGFFHVLYQLWGLLATTFCFIHPSCPRLVLSTYTIGSLGGGIFDFACPGLCMLDPRPSC